jgi:hypothetical protein
MLGHARLVSVTLVVLCLWGAAAHAHAQGLTAATVKAAGRSVKVVKVPLSQARIRVGLAKGLVGRTEDLAAIAKRYGAAAAINGCFFDAYTSGPLKNPHHTLISGGQWLHAGRVGTTLGFLPGNRPLMERLEPRIVGALDGHQGWPDSWYAYWINRKPESAPTVTIFTPRWGASTGLPGGIQAVVRGGVVTSVGTGSQAIPADGYVVYFSGSQTGVAKPFRVGRRCEWSITRRDGGSLGQWADVQEAIGCGPRLVCGGQVSCNPVGEGFSSPKILTDSGQRSMVGYTRGGTLILATAGGTVRQMADVMKALGCCDAMNLDGGASSGLWARGQYLTRPGRLISNALLVLPKAK